MAASVDLAAAKKNLSEALGDRMKNYLEFLKLWFKLKLTREEFDFKARKLLAMDSASRESSSSSHSSSKIASKSAKDDKRSRKRPRSGKLPCNVSKFLAANPLSMAPVIQMNPIEQEDKMPGYMSRLMVLPDVGMVQGRLMVSAWDTGLEDVNDDVVRILMQAIEVQLKRILMAVMSRRHGYKLREGCFKHSMGVELPRPSLRNTATIQDNFNYSEATSLSSHCGHMPSLKPSLETGMRDASTELSCAGDIPPTKYLMTLFDLFETLQLHKSAVPCHAVYAINMERIIHKLWHPTQEEIDAQVVM